MSIYNVLVIPQNLRREETVIQIAESLHYLTDVTNDIFRRVNNRLEIYSKNLNSIQERIEKINNKVSNVSTAKKAIQVFSSSKYPASEVNKPYETIFTRKDCPVKMKFDITYKETQTKDEPLEKLQFFHITSNSEEKVKPEGLGNMPTEFNSVNDFLLYNSGKNPYKEYVISDTLRASHMVKKQNSLEGPEIGAAPLSISESKTLTKISGENYFYSPDLGDVPTIDVPIDLPDLPGIADGLRYTDDAGPGIAPSGNIASSFPKATHFEMQSTKTESQIHQNTITNIPGISDEVSNVKEPLPKVETSKPLNEGIRKNKEVRKIEEVCNVKEVRKNEVHEDKEVRKDKKVTKDEEVHKDKKVSKDDEISKVVEGIKNGPVPPPIPEAKEPIVQITDTHASLMDAIRKAGGLKNAKLRSRPEQKEVSTTQSSGRDLISEFHTKLSLRRKGISGTKKGNEWDAASAMGRISEMLKPPPAKAEQSESATTDDEWD